MLPTRLVAPLSRSAIEGSTLPKRLAPTFDVQGQRLVLKPHEAGTIQSRLLVLPVASLKKEAHRIVDALDAVVSGL